MNTSIIFFIVLFAAVAHAGWSSLVKSNKEPLFIMGMTSIVEIMVFAPLIFFVPLPSLEIWFFIIASVFLHSLYRFTVVTSYQYGDLSFVYPIARGTSSLLLVLLSLIFLNDIISLIGFFGILIVFVGIFLIGYDRINQFNTKAFILACITALLIAFYTLIDGMGVREVENKFSYIFWLLFLNGIPVLSFALLNKREIFINITKKEIIKGLIAGILAILSYSLVVWAMKYIEIAYVSSIRETSIVIATLIGFFLLGEKQAKKRMVPAVLVLGGITILYFQI